MALAFRVYYIKGLYGERKRWLTLIILKGLGNHTSTNFSTDIIAKLDKLVNSNDLKGENSAKAVQFPHHGH